MIDNITTDETAERCDLHGDRVQVVHAPLISCGGLSRSCGRVATFRLDEDNRILKSHLQSPGEGQVAVVDVVGGVCAVVDDRLEGFAIDNQWAGIILN